MLAITIELLAGRYVASAYNDRDQVEWPPHPARLFSALLATWSEGSPDSTEGEAELNALRWLESQPPPDILASGNREVGRRRIVPMFVPVNDVSVVSGPSRETLEAAERVLAEASDARTMAKATRNLQRLEDKLLADTAKAIAAPTTFTKTDDTAADNLLPERRIKQPRTFPSAAPACPVFGFHWPEATPDEPIREALTRLLGRLSRLGHSSSLVRAQLATPEAISRLETMVARYLPDAENSEFVIRWVGEGQVEQLRAAFELHRETEPRVLPARFIRYGHERIPTETKPDCSIFDDRFIVLARISGPRLPSTSTVGVTKQLRRALIKFADQPIDELISGHTPDGRPSERPHLAIIALPVIAGPHPDGGVIGLGLILPRECPPESRTALMKALGRLEGQGGSGDPSDEPHFPLHLGEAGILQLGRVIWGEDRRTTLQIRTWTRPSTHWASATPVALDHNPGELTHADPAVRQAAFDKASSTILEALKRIGLSEAPLKLDVVRSCVLPATAKPRSFPRFPSEKDRHQRVLVHVRIVFEKPVRGPLLLGAGRFHGLGLLLPVDPAPQERSR